MTEIVRTKEYDYINNLQGNTLYCLEDYLSYCASVHEAKKYIIQLMGNNTRLKIPLTNSNGTNIQANREFLQQFKQCYLHKYGLNEGFFKLLELLNESNIIDNKHNSGMKLTKCINQNNLLGSDIVLMYSQIKNSYVLPQSYLVISVDPYDFITMGMGKGWTTCYKPMGDYYTGSYSISLDKYSFLTYITSEDTDFTDPVYAENKLYRRLGVFNTKYDGIMLSTQYPYKNQGFVDFTINQLKKYLLPSIQDNIVIENNSKHRMHKYISSQIYNDFTQGRKTTRELLYIGANYTNAETWRYGAIVKCLRCHQANALNDMPVCENCELELYDDNWGNKIGKYTI